MKKLRLTHLVVAFSLFINCGWAGDEGGVAGKILSEGNGEVQGTPGPETPAPAAALEGGMLRGGDTRRGDSPPLFCPIIGLNSSAITSAAVPEMSEITNRMSELNRRLQAPGGSLSDDVA